MSGKNGQDEKKKKILNNPISKKTFTFMLKKAKHLNKNIQKKSSTVFLLSKHFL